MRKIPIDTERARNLQQASLDAKKTLRLLPVTPLTTKTIIREVYEALRQQFEAAGYERGYKFESHDAITHFIREILKNEQQAAMFERYRLLRNKVNYAGKDIDVETARKALRDLTQHTSGCNRSASDCSSRHCSSR